jgi:hypothetical protein
VRTICAFALLALAAAGSLLLAGAARPYVAEGHPWPRGTIRYYNAAPDQAWAAKQAVTAWNTSGAHVRFVAVPASRADVRIEHFPRVSCTINAEATIGYTHSGRIWIFRRDDASSYCNPYMAAQALAHEFGHVLGLGHETRGCSAMNPTGSLRGPELCAMAQPWQWRCRLLTPDDVAGAVALYGGVAAAQRGPNDCDLYRGIGSPTRLTVTPTPASHLFRVSFRRPASTRIPAFLAARSRQTESSVAAASSTGCPADAHAFPRRAWDIAVSGTEHAYLQLPTGTSCVSVWAVDSFSRPSDRPAVLSVRVLDTR